MSHKKEYDIRLNLEKVNQCFINGRSFLATLSIVLQNMENTDILEYVKRILPTEEYNYMEEYVKNYKLSLKEFDLKNDIQLVYLLYIFADFTDEFENCIKEYIKRTF
ncbi:unnamed protein product [Rhizophagus irregularis]|nr:unnamed protein product [Rhizophagus irregularis]